MFSKILNWVKVWWRVVLIPYWLLRLPWEITGVVGQVEAAVKATADQQRPDME